ncbi:MAG: hypothetical protein Q4G46_15660, partial [Propionibacteriaceae bacterium]|nr:hypothetical protein [Propionibacteriaceae bacterium]
IFGWVRVAWKVLVDNALLRRTGSTLVRANRDRDRQLSYQQCRRIDLTLRDPHEIELDGDHFGEILAVRMHVEDGALLVQMPADWSPEAAEPTAEEQIVDEQPDPQEPVVDTSTLDPAEQASAAAEAKKANEGWD